MTKAKNEPTRKDAERRRFAEFEIRAAGDNENELYVEGYAAMFNSPTVLWEYDGIEYKEEIDARAFDEADMTDVIFNYNHSGRVYARTRNNTLKLALDTKGLFSSSLLNGGKPEHRDFYEDIKSGLIDRMSFSFTVAEESYSKETHTRRILKIKKVYDVSAVDIPAYDNTSISARSFFELEREKEHKALESAELRKRLIIKTML
jgi:HK97 family phage prohead protease